MDVVSMDAHLRYTVAVVEDEQGRNRRRERIDHAPGAIRRFASRFNSGTPIAVEALGSWYWIVDEIEEAGMVPKLVNAGKAKALLGSRNKTDHLDAKGLNVLQRTGTLPTVWIPPAVLRDQRELYRARMFMKRQCTRLKNRILATLAKYALSDIDATDRFGKKGREEMERRIAKLPRNAQYVVQALLTEVDQHEHCVQELEFQMEDAHCSDPRVDLLARMSHKFL